MDHVRELQDEIRDIGTWENRDLWEQINDLLQEATAEILIHKVYSHDLESSCAAPLEDFCRVGNNWADCQAEVANSTRGRVFDGIYRRYSEYYGVWCRRVELYTSFVLDIAKIDCSPHDVEETDVCIADLEFPVFDTFPNRASVAQAFSSLAGNFDVFTEVHSPFFKAVFHRLVQWVIDTDQSSATSRPVCLLELYVGFRISGDGRLPISGDQVVDRYSPVTFAVDFSYFKQVLLFATHSAGLECGESHNLVELGVFLKTPTILVGWPSAIEQRVFQALVQFVQRRPIRNVQSLSRPWQP